MPAQPSCALFCPRVRSASETVALILAGCECLPTHVRRKRNAQIERDLGTFLVLHRGTNFTRNQYMDMIVRPTSFARAHIFELIRYVRGHKVQRDVATSAVC